MGISDDIKPKHRLTSTSHRNSDDFLDDFSYEGIVGSPATSEDREEYERKESLENDFFGKKHEQHDDYKNYYESYHDNDVEPENHEKKRKKTKKHNGGKLAKTVIWLMTIAIVALVVWQNKSEIVSLIKEKILKETPAVSPVESKNTNDYYAGETSGNSNTNTNSTLSLNTNSSAPATASTTNNSAISIEILNGNGIKNSGSAAKSTLEKAGFTVAKTANAKNFNYATTLIYYKTGKEAAANAVKDALAGKDITIENNDTLAGEYDVVIVLGAK